MLVVMIVIVVMILRCSHLSPVSSAPRGRAHARADAHTSRHGVGGRRVHLVAAKAGSLVERLLVGDTIRVTVSIPVTKSFGNDTKSVAACRRGPAAAANFFRVYQILGS